MKSQVNMRTWKRIFAGWKTGGPTGDKPFENTEQIEIEKTMAAEWHEHFVKPHNFASFWYCIRISRLIMGKQYYCDFCDKAFADNAASKKNHFNGAHHQRMRRAHYDAFRGTAVKTKIGKGRDHGPTHFHYCSVAKRMCQFNSNLHLALATKLLLLYLFPSPVCCFSIGTASNKTENWLFHGRSELSVN